MLYCSNSNCSNPFNPDRNNFCQSCGQQILSPLFRNRYRVIRLLGEGGFGRTYEAIDTDKLDDTCLIKQFFPQVQGTAALEKATELFKQEAKQLYDLGEHPQIPRLIAYFEQDKRLYLVQEFIEGQTLLQELEQQGKFSEEKIKQLLLELLPVLKFVHDSGIIHRDIKPENIMRRTKDGKLLLIDFGVSKQATGTVLGKVGTTVGTPGYAPMEQMRGQVYPASDLYSLGITCIRLMTGCLLKEDGTDHIYDGLNGCFIWRKHLPSGVNISADLGKVLDKLIQDYVKARYQSADEVLTVICNALPLTPDLIIGTWCGNFGSKNKPATLVIIHQSNESSFKGNLTVRDLAQGTYRIKIQVELDAEINEVTIKELEILSQPWWYWSLGENKGTLLQEQNKISGQGKDSRQSYLWSFVKLDYSRLTSLLSRGQWKEADQETGTIMLKIACREDAGYLSSKDIENFPCKDLHIIDQLWVKYSNGYFGFSIQKRIWRIWNSDWKKCGDRFGWRVNNNWKNYSDLNFTLNSPEGAFPTFWGGEGRKLVFGYSGCWEDFFSRLEVCGL